MDNIGLCFSIISSGACSLWLNRWLSWVFRQVLSVLCLPLLYYFLKEDRIINVNAATIIIRGKEAKTWSLKIKEICEGIISFHCEFAQCGNTLPLISHHIYEWLIEDDRPASHHHTHYRGQNRPDSVNSSTIWDFLPPNLQMLEAFNYCLTHA